MTHPNQHKQYLRTKIQTASREELVLMLFDGVGRFCELGKLALIKGKHEDSHEALLRAQAIIMELLYGLDREQGGEIAENLGRLYGYTFNCLIAANMKKKPEKIEEVQGIFRELREGWTAAMNKLKAESATAAPDQPEAAPPAPATPAGAASADVQPAKKTVLSMPAPAPAPGELRPRLSVQG